MNDGSKVTLLRGHEREPRRKIKTHLVAEHAQGAGAGTVFLADAMLAYMTHQIEILFHEDTLVVFFLYARIISNIPNRIIGADNTWPIVIQPSLR